MWTEYSAVKGIVILLQESCRKKIEQRILKGAVISNACRMITKENCGCSPAKVEESGKYVNNFSSDEIIGIFPNIER